MAPEVLREELNYTSNIDVYSTGMVIYEALFNKIPWYNKFEHKIL